MVTFMVWLGRAFSSRYDERLSELTMRVPLIAIIMSPPTIMVFPSTTAWVDPALSPALSAGPPLVICSRTTP